MPGSALSIAGWVAVLAAGGLRPQMLVSTGWLAGHLREPKVVVLHVAREKTSYDAGHIPGARFLSYRELAITRDGIPSELPPTADLQRLFEGLGVSDQTRMVLYGDYFGLSAARAYFSLDYLGCAGRAALLDGGLEKWRAEGRPVSTQTPQWQPGRLKVGVRPEVVASREAVMRPAAGVVLLDVRDPAEYAAGHIPGAVQVFWVDGLESKANPVLRQPEELRRLYEAAGLKTASKVITYCGAGVQAAQAYFTLKYLGYRVALYDGSLSEWTRVPGAPLVKGTVPK
jgi:thiosulfate/3-mercaptopyruvate sulfurtransferase